MTEQERKAHNAKQIKTAFAKVAKAEMVVKLVKTEPRPVDNAASAEADRVWDGISAMNGKGTVETPQPEHRKSSIPGHTDAWLYGSPTGAASKPVSKPLAPYAIEETFSPAPTGLNFVIDSKNHGLPVPENFDAPTPGTVKMGDGYVLKSADFWKGTVADRPMSKNETIQAVAKLQNCFGRNADTHEVIKSAGDSESEWAELHGPSRG